MAALLLAGSGIPARVSRLRFFLRYLDTSGNLSPYFTLAQVKASRITGVPQLALLDKQLFLAWTETQREQNKTAVIRIPTLSLTEAKPQYLQFLQD